MVINADVVVIGVDCVANVAVVGDVADVDDDSTDVVAVRVVARNVDIGVVVVDVAEVATTVGDTVGDSAVGSVAMSGGSRRRRVDGRWCC